MKPTRTVDYGNLGLCVLWGPQPRVVYYIGERLGGKREVCLDLPHFEPTAAVDGDLLIPLTAIPPGVQLQISAEMLRGVASPGGGYPIAGPALDDAFLLSDAIDREKVE